MAKRDNHKAARALAEWALSNFSRSSALTVAQNHEIAERTLWRYLAALKDDTELSALLDDATQSLLNSGWASRIDKTMSKVMDKIDGVLEDKQSLSDLTNAFRQIAEIALAKQVLEDA